MNEFDYEIKHVNTHYELYVNGSFICSGDSFSECAEDLDEYIHQQKIKA